MVIFSQRWDGNEIFLRIPLLSKVFQWFCNHWTTTTECFFHWLTIDINGFFNGFPQVLVRARIWCELKKGVFFGNFSQIQKLSRLPGNFPDCPETFQTVQKLSRLSKNFPDSPETFQTVRKLSRLPGNFPDCPETFQTVRKLSRLMQCFKLI